MFDSQIPIVLHKQPELDEAGHPVCDAEGKQRYRCGFRVGGGIDQDPTKSPQGYPDRGVYVTYVYEGSPAQLAGLQVHDKLLQVNGHDLTVATHKKAVDYIGRRPVLNILVYRKGIPTIPTKQMPYQPQQQLHQQQFAPVSRSNQPFPRQY